jgi:hypothetical protein
MPSGSGATGLSDDGSATRGHASSNQRPHPGTQVIHQMSKLDLHGLSTSLHSAGKRWRLFIIRTTLGPVGTGTEAPVNVPMTRDRSHPGR